jgi:hypothetical protein
METSLMKRALILAVALAGCGDPADSFRAAAPSHAAVSLDAPGDANKTTASASAASVGQRAAFYEITRAITLVVNGGVGVTLQLLETLTDLPPASVTATEAVWGPWTPEHSLLTWKFVVDKIGASDYQHTLSAKLIIAPDSSYAAIISGKAHVVSRFVGSGDFVFDFSPLRILDPAVKQQGGVTVHYDNSGDPRVVDVGFKAFTDGNGTYTPDGATYHFVERNDHSGSFSFVAQADVDHDPLGTLETASIVSKWAATGQGRSDIQASGGSLVNATASATECWDSSFARTYFTDSWNPTSTEGDASTCIQ